MSAAGLLAGAFIAGQGACIAASTPPPVAEWVRAAVLPPAAGPQAVRFLHTEGTLPHAGIHDRSVAAERDFRYMLDLALAWRYAQDRAALSRLAIYFDAWASTYQPRFNPIDETGFATVIDAYRLTAADLPPATVQHMRAFLFQLAHGYLDDMDDHREATRPIWRNNWQSHRIKLVTLAAAALNDGVLFGRARAAFVAQISANILPDGAVIDFAQRDALHYVVYDLEPLTVAALAARGRGEDWLTLQGDRGQTLASALDWLLPYAQGARQHEEFVHSTVAFDAARAEAGVQGYAGLWDRRTAGGLYWAATLLDPRYAATARALKHAPPPWLWAYAGACRRTP